MYSFKNENERESVENAKAKIVYNVVLGFKGLHWSPSTIILCIVLMMEMKQKV